MPQAVWTGSLSFGLVNIPIKLYVATAAKDIRFHQFETGTGRRIRYRRVASGPAAEGEAVPESEAPRRVDASPEAGLGRGGADPRESAEAPSGAGSGREGVPLETSTEPEVAWDRVVKGYEIEPGRVVTLTPDELLGVAPERSRVLEVEQFVDPHRIDPVHFEKSYYAVPAPGAESARPYSLLLRAMQDSEKVAIGRFVMRTREYLAAIRPADEVLMLETLFYADEIRDPKEIWTPLLEEPPERELRVARQLIEALEGDWDAARYRDSHRERVLELLRSKAPEAFVVPEAPEEEGPPPKAVDLMEALKRSVEAAGRARGDEERERRHRTG